MSACKIGYLFPPIGHVLGLTGYQFGTWAGVAALRSAAIFVPAGYGVRPWPFKNLHNVIFSRGAKQKRKRDVMNGVRNERPAKPAVTRLDLIYRVTFLLSAVEGPKYREIADVTEVSIGTVMGRLSRARSTLAADLTGFAASNATRASVAFDAAAACSSKPTPTNTNHSQAGTVYRVSSPKSPFPTRARRKGKVVYFLVADSDRVEPNVLKVVYPTPADAIVTGVG